MEDVVALPLLGIAGTFAPVNGQVADAGER